MSKTKQTQQSTNPPEENEMPPMEPGEPKRYSLKRKEIPVILEDPETGADGDYILREITGKSRDAYLNMINSRMGTNGNLRDTRGIQSTLISWSLFRVNADGSETQVKIAEVEAFPGSVQDALHKDAQLLSALGKKAEDKEKND